MASPQDAISDEDIVNLAKEAYEEIQRRHNEKKKEALEQALAESRDAVLAALPAPQFQHKVYSKRLPAHGDAPNLQDIICCQPCSSSGGDAANDASVTSDDDQRETNDAAPSAEVVLCNRVSDAVVSSCDTETSVAMLSQGKDGESPTVSVRMRGSKSSKPWTEKVPAIFLEGAPETHPSGTTAIFLKTNIAGDDETNLNYVPYFGENDDEDVVSDLYNTETREKMIEVGPEYKERETNLVIQDTLALVLSKLGTSPSNDETLTQRIREALSSVLKVDIERISHVTSSTGNDDGSAKPSSARSPSRPQKQAVAKSDYLSAEDSYRALFCRRCFTYDCNIHGLVTKPDAQLQAEQAIQKEREGFWIEKEYQKEDAKLSASGESATKRRICEAVARLYELSSESKELTSFQKSICERLFFVQQGDLDKVALGLGARRDFVAAYVASQQMAMPEFQHIQLDPHASSKRRKKFMENKLMKTYNPAWLKLIKEAKIHPFFTPCAHIGPCSEVNCDCIKNRFFCTKHCACAESCCRHVFRGCACKGGKCRTHSCPCYAASRECDPDLCLSCGACTDAPNRPAAVQRCRNDGIGMRRHCHLLLAKSGIEDAGWGIYTKLAIKKNDFVQEYVGECISQEEAERRGQIYDKANLSYLFNLSSDYVIDAFRKGNKTRFANHSKKANCETRMVWVNGDIRIGLYATKDIEPQTELFFNYRYDVKLDNDQILMPGISVDWMEDPKMAHKIRKKHT